MKKFENEKWPKAGYLPLFNERTHFILKEQKFPDYFIKKFGCFADFAK